MHPVLDSFVACMDGLCAHEDEPGALARGAARHLRGLLAHPEFLAAPHRVSRPERYSQHIVHVHPGGMYSLVSLVWLPGQCTPIHDHHCWCVVGVLEGSEREVRYSLAREGDREWLAAGAASTNPPGSVSQLVPPEENIHRVENASGGTAISLHVYGADIAKLGSSVNQVFGQEVRPDAPPEAASVPWRPSVADVRARR